MGVRKVSNINSELQSHSSRALTMVPVNVLHTISYYTHGCNEARTHRNTVCNIIVKIHVRYLIS